jgi:hypothetical protein
MTKEEIYKYIVEINKLKAEAEKLLEALEKQQQKKG